MTTDEAAADAAPTPAAPAAPLLPDLATLLGGRRGIVDASVPGIVLVSVDVFARLPVAIGAAVATTAVIGVLRLLRHEPLRQAVSGLLGIALAAGLAALSGDAKTFFLPGILINVGYALGCAGSVLVRRPLLGYVATALDRRFTGWRDDTRLRRAAAYATLVWAAIFGCRAVVQGWLYVHDHETWLATARLAMGWPLWGLAVLVSLLLLQPPDGSDHPGQTTRVSRLAGGPSAARR